MRSKNSILLPAAAGLLCVAAPLPGADLFSESFDAEATTRVGQNNGTGMIVEFVDYSAMTVGAITHNIPEAPRQIPGSAATHGVLMRVDYLNTPAATERIANLFSLDDVGGSRLTFIDNYRLRFDCYLRLSPTVTPGPSGFPTDAGTTEQVLWGVGYNATLPMGRGWRTARGNGVWGWLANEGGHGTTAGGDAALYNGPTLVAGRNMDLVSAADDTSTYFTPAFGADATPVPHCPANQWVEANITVSGGLVTVEYMAVGRTRTKFFLNSSGGSVAGAVMVGYEDSFVSNSFDPDNQWMLLDNVVVEDLTPPTMLVTPVTPIPTYTGTPVTGTFSIANARQAGNLTVTAVTFEGADAPAFSLVTPLPIVVAPNSSVPLDIRFAPAAPDGVKTATVTLVSDDPQSPNYIIGNVRARRSVGGFLEAHYKLDETSGTNAVDSSGNGSTAAFQVRDALVFGNQSLLGAPDTGTAIGFLPAQSSAAGNYISSTVVHTPTFSVSLWMKPAATGATRTLLQRDYDFGSTYDKIFGLYLTPSNTVKYRVRSTDIFESDAGAPLADDAIWHVVLTHLDNDGFENETAARSRLYVNGLMVMEKTAADTKGFGDFPFNPVISGLQIGTRTVAGAGYSGDLDDIQVYGAELTREQVWEIFRNRGATASPEFRILQAARAAAPPAFLVNVPSSPQGSYRLFRSGNLQTWQAVGVAVTGDAAEATTALSDPSPPAGVQYYRVERME